MALSSFTSAAKNSAVTRVGSKPRLRADQPATNGLSAGKKLQNKLYGADLHKKIYVSIPNLEDRGRKAIRIVGRQCECTQLCVTRRSNIAAHLPHSTLADSPAISVTQKVPHLCIEALVAKPTKPFLQNMFYHTLLISNMFRSLLSSSSSSSGQICNSTKNTTNCQTITMEIFNFKTDV